MTDFRSLFYDELARRNPEQLRAIESINGPVMVIAGPGTGKTDVLGLRIGYILEQTQTSIQSILCLTFTEAGAMEMRRRLHKYIGPAAYNAQIFTFHGFCNMVIHEHLDRFGVYREAQPVSDLEQFQILRQLLDQQPLDHPLRRFTGKMYYETRRLRNLYEVMKMEQWSSADMLRTIDRWMQEQRDGDKYRYKRAYTRQGVKYAKGDFKPWEYEAKVERPMSVLKSAVELFDTYNRKLIEAGRYDYQDMLTWVHDALKEDPDLLASYQERYQFFHVDEFQDTNGIQLDILRLLAGHWERPDIFIVGDDDQSIFRFQGANMHNITLFKQEYDPEVIILTDNYRSTQRILDASSALIKNNIERLVAQFPEYTKNLKARGENADLDTIPEVRIYPNWTQEQAAVLQEITTLHESGALKQMSVAIIYRMHRQVEDLVHIMEVREIPLNVKKPVNILHRPVIRNILNIFKYLSLEVQRMHSGEFLLYEIMQYAYFGIPTMDAGRVAIAARHRGGAAKGTPWREIMGSEKFLNHIGVDSPEPILALDALLQRWTTQFHHLTIQELFEEMLTRGGIFQWIFEHPNTAWHLQIVKTFMDELKQECQRDPGITLVQFLDNLGLMEENGIEIPVHKILNAPNGVHLVTAHSAKGLEFDRVYMIGCTKNVWDEARTGSPDRFALPDLVPSSSEETDEDERRLFYVGMTRARKDLIISYALQDDNERELEASRFVNEVIGEDQAEAKKCELSSDAFGIYCRDLFRPLEVETPLIDPALLREVLDGFEMSVSALNKYLECPRKFYFENVLRIPSAYKTYFGFGSAIHGTMEKFFNWKVHKQEVSGTAQDLVDMFSKEIASYRAHFTDAEFEAQRHFGRQILESYFDQRAESWTRPAEVHAEYKIRNTHHRGIPVKGDVDRVDIYDDHIEVIDYKTGQFKNASKYKKLVRPDERYPLGGDYWRQIVFYKLLLDAQGEFSQEVTGGTIDFVVPRSSGEHALHRVVITPDDTQFVSDQLVEAYHKIINQEFQDGCRKPDCYWCNLVERGMEFDPAEPLPVHEDPVHEEIP